MKLPAKLLSAFALSVAAMSANAPAANAYEPFIGEVRTFGYTFCPRGWAEADGALLPISQNTALFSLYGTNFGGDGRTTFGLPDLRGRVIVGPGQGPGLSNYYIGQKGGTEQTNATTPVEPSGEEARNVTNDHPNLPPYQALKSCIALQGIYPSRN